MACVNSDKFSANDLVLFIESLEQISRMESSRKQKRQKHRERNFGVNYLEPSYCDGSSSTLKASDNTADESFLEKLKEDPIAYNSTCVSYNQYSLMDPTNLYNNVQDKSFNTDLYSMPFGCASSTKFDDCYYETLNTFNHQYEDPGYVIKHTKAKYKLSLFGLVRKKYKRCFSSKSNYCYISKSWTKLV